MKRLPLVVAVASVISVACRDRQPLQPPAGGSPAFLISDGAHSGGNPDFFFLPPLAADPSGNTNFDVGRFNSKLSPVVEVCQLGADPRLVPTTDCVTAKPVFGLATMPLDGEQYQLNWDTKASLLLDNQFYRVIVRGAPLGTPLGFLDLDPVTGGMKNVKTGDVVAFQDGRTLPIKVRIEDGAFGSTNRSDHVERVVRNVATTVTTNTGFAGAAFPDDWLPAGAVDAGINQVVVIVERIPIGGEDEPSCLGSGLLEREGCYRFRTDPDLNAFGDFSQPVTAGVCFEIPDLIGHENGPPLQLYRRAEGEEPPPAEPLEETQAPFLTCSDFTPTQVIGAIKAADLRRLASAGWRALVAGVRRLVMPPALHAVDLGAGGKTGRFSRIGWARSATMSKDVTTDNLTGLINTKLPIDPKVCLTFSHHSESQLLVGEPVTFTVAPGSGTLGGGNSVTVNTTAEGEGEGARACASAAWVLGGSTSPGGNILTVTALADGSPVTFTATGLTSITIDFDVTPAGAAVTPGTVVNSVYATQGITFTKLGPGTNCGSGPQVYANGDNPGGVGNTVSTCPQGIASDISANSLGVIQAAFASAASGVCIDVRPPATGFAFLESFDAVGATLGRTTSSPGVNQTLCISGTGIRSVRFSGDGDNFARFDNLVISF